MILKLDYQKILGNVKSWVREVGELQLKGVHETLSIESKSTEFDLVTDIDKKSEQVLIDKIKTNYPFHAILSEESGASENTSEYLWVIDPLDGTVNYAHRFSDLFDISSFTILWRNNFRGCICTGFW